MPAQKPINGVLLADQGSSSIPGSSRVLLLHDLNGDGDALDAGERTVFFDGTNASGFGTPTENVFTVHQAKDGSVFIGDGTTDTVYRLLDLNGDGDANDAGEATAWLTSDVAGGFSLITPNGITQGPDGAMYIANAGTSSTPQDGIYRTQDLNGDGDALDAGERSVWLNLQDAAQTTSPTNLNRPVPYEIEFTSDNVAYLIDPNGGAPLIRRIEDLDSNGSISANEVTTFISDSDTTTEADTFGAPVDFSLENDGESVLVWEWLDNGPSNGKHSLYRLTDLNGSGTIDTQEEAVEIWNSSQMPAGFITDVGFSVASDGQGRVALTSNGSAANAKNVILLEDKDGDGTYLQAAETIILSSNSSDATTLYRPRAVEFYTDPTPVISSNGGDTSAAISVDENTTTVTTVTATDGNTPAADLRYAIAGGADAARFIIDSVTGGLSFQSAPDYEVPTDADIDNVYEVEVRATDGTLSDVQSLSVTVTNVNEGGGGNPNPTPVPTPGQPTTGPDNLTGTSGADSIAGGLGSDSVAGGDGNDLVLGNQGNDLVLGNQGDDRVYGGQGDDAAYGGQGNDYVEGNLGNDQVFGNLGNDVVLGNEGDDVVAGNEGADTVHGGQGNDIVFGGQGDDQVFGNLGNDDVWGGQGNDTLSGGAGADVFRFAVNSGDDIIVDFSRAEGDTLDFGGQSYTVADVSGSAVFTLSGGGTIVLTGVSAASLDAGAFA